MRYNIRKMTFEDRFDRKYRCNAHRFLPDMKRSNRREFRRKIKKDLRKQIRGNMTELKPYPYWRL